MKRHLRQLLLAIGIIAIAVMLAWSQSLLVQLDTDRPGVGQLGERLMVAIPITNDGALSATNVQLSSVSLGLPN